MILVAGVLVGPRSDRNPVGCRSHLNRVRTRRRGSVAELAGPVGAPRPQGAVRLDGKYMAPRTNGGPIRRRSDLRRSRTATETPGPQRTVGLHGLGVMSAGLRRLPVRSGTHANGTRPICLGAVTQLSRGVVTPGPQRVIGSDRHVVVADARQRCPRCRRADLLRARPVGGCSVTHLTQIVGAPRPQGAVGLQRQGVAVTTGNGEPIRRRTDLDGNGAFGGGCITHLTGIISTPGPQGAVGLHSQPVRSTGVHQFPIGGRTELHRLSPIARRVPGAGAPTPQRAVLSQSQREAAAGGNRLPCRVDPDPAGAGVRHRRPITQLTRPTVSPRPGARGAHLGCTDPCGAKLTHPCQNTREQRHDGKSTGSSHQNPSSRSTALWNPREIYVVGCEVVPRPRTVYAIASLRSRMSVACPGDLTMNFAPRDPSSGPYAHGQPRATFGAVPRGVQSWQTSGTCVDRFATAGAVHRGPGPQITLDRTPMGMARSLSIWRSSSGERPSVVR